MDQIMKIWPLSQEPALYMLRSGGTGYPVDNVSQGVSSAREADCLGPQRVDLDFRSSLRSQEVSV
jgi:hypothetical protein